VHGYASLFVDPAAVAVADAWLAQPGWPELLRRLVRGGRDAQARALAPWHVDLGCGEAIPLPVPTV
jgi:hypothetical protein